MRTYRLIAVVTALAASTLGCAGSAPEPGFSSTLTQKGGCADVILFAVNPDQTVMVTFRSPGAVASANHEGRATTTDITLPSTSAKLVLELGEHLSSSICNDVVIGGRLSVSRTYVPVSGSAKLTIVPGATDLAVSKGDLVLNDVVFAPEDGGDTVEIKQLEVRGVSVGWFPG